jgi:hypothetical protein
VQLILKISNGDNVTICQWEVCSREERDSLATSENNSLVCAGRTVTGMNGRVEDCGPVVIDYIESTTAVVYGAMKLRGGGEDEKRMNRRERIRRRRRKKRRRRRKRNKSC